MIEKIIDGKIYRIGNKYFEISELSNNICMNCHELKEGLMIRIFVREGNVVLGELRFCEKCAKKLGLIE